MQGGFLRDGNGALSITSDDTSASWRGGFLRDPDGALVVSGDSGGGGGGSSKLDVVVHGSDGSAARPSAQVVFWIGSAQPANMRDDDIWFEPGS